ncbi:MAG: acetyl-CoA C-acyltransferase [Roseovarius sp.]|uniref:acetyl-CoA C-acyltransferase n=1 Tax=Roseovarius sp. TaxID=1486281 RepID=UPI0032EF05CE
MRHGGRKSRTLVDERSAHSPQRQNNVPERRLIQRPVKGEVFPAFDKDGTAHEHDDGVRPDSSIDKLAKLNPAFEKPYGKVTPGNSSQITDGASWTILASETAVEAHGLTPIAKIVDSEWAALDPGIMGLGPVLASTPLAQRHGLSVDDVDLWEINEAFAAQVLACLAAWQDDDFCRDVLGYDNAFGRIDHDRLNVDGGAISLGHPVGTSGNRIVLHLANALKARGAKRGIATECIGGGQGGAMLLEAA